MTNLFYDLRFALRQLRRASGFTLSVVCVLALGIGANAGIFTVLEATLFRPLPYRSPGQLVKLDLVPTGQPFLLGSLADTLAWRERNHTLAQLAYYNSESATVTTAPVGGTNQQADAVRASANLFSLLGIPPALGRGFSPAEQQPGKDDLIVLSDALWRTQFHADPAVLGHSLFIDGQPAVVIGVMPRGFLFPADGKSAQLWRPLSLGPDTQKRGLGASGAESIARLRPGVQADDASRDLSAIQKQLIGLYPANMHEFLATQVEALSYRRSLNSKDQRSAILALFAAASVLWLIACANVSGLMLARAAARRRELATRAALGASQARLLRAHITEALLLSVAGGAVGLTLADLTLSLLRHRLVQTFTREIPLHPDARVLLALSLLSLLSALLCAGLPALLTVNSSLEQVLRADGLQTSATRTRQSLQSTLIVAELALTLSLLVCCGLLLRTVFALRHVPLGFRTDHVYVITPHLAGYQYDDIDRYRRVYRPLVDRIRTLPGIEAAALNTVAPLTNWLSAVLAISPDSTKNSIKKTISTQLNAADPDLKKVLGFRMLRGRFFSPQDTPTAAPVMVVNRAFANAYQAAGGNLSNFTLGDKDRKFTVIGVVDDYHQNGIATAAGPQLILNAIQMRPEDGFYQPTLKVNVQIAIRSGRAPADLLPEINHVMRQLNPDLVASDVQTMDEIVEDSIGSQLLAAHLLELLGGLALAVAIAGLYSLLAYLTTQRTREFGIRLALGAQRGAVFNLVLRQAGAMLLAGSVIGLAIALAMTHLLSRFLFGVTPTDPTTLLLAWVLLVFIGLAAAYFPARHAAAINPNEALRTE